MASGVSLIDTMDVHDYGASTSASKRILIIYTGGTIGMLPEDESDPTKGLRPDKHYLRLKVEELRTSYPNRLPDFEIMQYDPLLDSSAFTPSEWAKVAVSIEKNYYDFDGFVVLHGTDTMSYTACALAFMLRGLAKPVILTGSQLPLYNPVSDARSNLIASMLVAAYEDIPEVCIFFSGKLLRGSRSHKADAVHPDAFMSPNYPILGQIGHGLHVNTGSTLPQPKVRFRTMTQLNKHIAVLHMIPGFSNDAIRNLVAPPLQGLVLATYGTGNAPRKGLADLLQSAIEERGLVVVVVSQCQVGSVDLSTYVAGSHLSSAGVVCGHDMTVECASTKLAWLIGQGYSVTEIKRLLETPLCGEITIDGAPPSFNARL